MLLESAEIINNIRIRRDPTSDYIEVKPTQKNLQQIQKLPLVNESNTGWVMGGWSRDIREYRLSENMTVTIKGSVENEDCEVYGTQYRGN